MSKQSTVIIIIYPSTFFLLLQPGDWFSFSSFLQVNTRRILSKCKVAMHFIIVGMKKVREGKDNRNSIWFSPFFLFLLKNGEQIPTEQQYGTEHSPEAVDLKIIKVWIFYDVWFSLRKELNVNHQQAGEWKKIETYWKEEGFRLVRQGVSQCECEWLTTESGPLLWEEVNKIMQ